MSKNVTSCTRHVSAAPVDLLVAAVSLVTLVLSSLDQSTRGPSLTGMVLTNIGRLV